jgi:hypothetical protein
VSGWLGTLHAWRGALVVLLVLSTFAPARDARAGDVGAVVLLFDGLCPWGPEFLWAGLALKATHGYPPETPGVESIFYAWGAGVARGREVKGLRAIDVHPTVAELLEILPGSPVDGAVSLDVLARATSP